MKLNAKKQNLKFNYRSFYEHLNNQLTGGIGDATAPSTVDPVELSMGQTIEMEHTSDPNIATEIALDHLREDPKYYTKLKKSGLAKEFDIINPSSGFGDLDHPINSPDKIGLRSKGESPNMGGKINKTPPIDSAPNYTDFYKKDDYTVDLDINDPTDNKI